MDNSDYSSRIAVTCRQPAAVIMVHLPFDQHSKVALQSGFTVKDKVGRKLCSRMVPLEACCVREKRKSGEERIVNWNEDLSRLNSDSELTVYLLQPKISFQHKIIRQTTLTSCNICSKRIYLHGHRCELCAIVFHRKCGSNIPNICTPTEKCSENVVKRKKCLISDYGIQTGEHYQRFVGPKPNRNETFHQNKINLVSNDSELLHKRDELESWEIKSLNVKKNCRIGAGAFGYVYKGVWYGDVAIKTVKNSSTDESEQALLNEFEILKKIRHVNILMLKGFLREPRLGIVIQWCDNLSLYKHLHVNEPPTKFSSCDISCISKQIAQGMAYLHSKDILHRDLKSNNIFLTDDMTVKIGDFGLATTKSLCQKANHANQLTGSILWMAPEVIRMEGENPFTFAADVYSFGIVLYELATCSLPYRNDKDKDMILFMVGRGLLKPDFAKIRPDISCSFKNLIHRCTEFDRNNRPDFKMILNVLTNLHFPQFQRSSSSVVLPNNDQVEIEIDKGVNGKKKESLQVSSNGSVVSMRQKKF